MTAYSTVRYHLSIDVFSCLVFYLSVLFPEGLFLQIWIFLRCAYTTSVSIFYCSLEVFLWSIYKLDSILSFLTGDLVFVRDTNDISILASVLFIGPLSGSSIRLVMVYFLSVVHSAGCYVPSVNFTTTTTP